MSQPATQPDTPQGGGRAARAGLTIVAVGALLLAAFGFYYLFLRPEGPAAVGESTLPPIASAAPTEAAATDGGTAAPAATEPIGSGIEGSWAVDGSVGSFDDFTSSFVGYRVQEELAGIGAKTAVGRTPNVTGGLTIAGTAVTEATIEADLTTLESDDRNRDGQLGRQGIETDQFPTATFTITEPIELGAVPAEGEEIAVTAVGQLTLHGQTRDVEVPMTARLGSGVITVQGSIPILFSDYGIQKPESFKVLSVEDNGVMEFQVHFSQA